MNPKRAQDISDDSLCAAKQTLGTVEAVGLPQKILCLQKGKKNFSEGDAVGGAGQCDHWLCRMVSVVLTPRKNEGEPYSKEEYVKLCTLPYKEELYTVW